MELRQIRSFLSIAVALHFGRTAEMIHLSQPALSLQIRALEDEIGVAGAIPLRRVLPSGTGVRPYGQGAGVS
jgi:DNA-binding transcriptional LysR family regulator